MGPNAQGPEGLVGQVVAGYQLVRLLGMGATGAVFLGERLVESPAELEKTGSLPVERPKYVAMKLLILPWQLTPADRNDFRLRFLREAQTLKRLRHESILSVLDYGEDQATGFTYMVLRYLSGGTLATYIADHIGPISLAEISTYLTLLASALDYAHAQHIVHRDIKPANILLDEQGKPQLSDFSIVRILAETTTKLTTTGRIMGTPAYMSPEQVTGGEAGPSTDIYSLGMVIYEMVTGKTAFDAATIMDLIRQQVQEAPPPPRQLRPELPEPAEAAILRSLAKNPADRFATAAEFASAFASGLHGEWAAGLTAFIPGTAHTAAAQAPTLIAPHAWLTPPPPPRRRKHPVLATVLTGALTLLIISGFALAAMNRGGLFNFFGGGSNTPTVGVASGAGTPTPTATVHHIKTPGGPEPTNTPIIVYVGGPTPAPGATPVPTDTPQPTDTPLPQPTPTDTPVPPPTPTATPCPYVDNHGQQVTFYTSSNYSGQSYQYPINPGQDIKFVFPSYLQQNLNSISDPYSAFHIVTFHTTTFGGNFAHWNASNPGPFQPVDGYEYSASAEVYFNRTC